MKFAHFAILLFCVVCTEYINCEFFGRCKLPAIQNGKATMKKNGRNARIKCNPSYQLMGDQYATCLRGMWVRIPVCVRSGCNSLPLFNNGHKYGTYRGAVVSFVCDPGYSIVGSTQIYCDGQFWNGSMPQCTANESGAPTSCDFESLDWCGWTQDQTQSFNWIIQRSWSTRRTSTGPRYDHTIGSSYNGNFISARPTNDTTKIYSPVYSAQLTSSQPSCFIFWYYIHESFLAYINIYLKSENTPGLRVLKRITVTRISTEDWVKANVLLPFTNHRFQIVLEASGVSHYGIIALDDLKVTSGSDCQVPVETTSQEPTEIEDTSKLPEETVAMVYASPPSLAVTTQLSNTLSDFSNMLNSTVSTKIPTIIYKPRPWEGAAGETVEPRGVRIPIPTYPTPLILKPQTLVIPRRTFASTASIPSTTTLSTTSTAATGHQMKTTSSKTTAATTTIAITTNATIKSTTKPMTKPTIKMTRPTTESTTTTAATTTTRATTRASSTTTTTTTAKLIPIRKTTKRSTSFTTLLPKTTIRRTTKKLTTTVATTTMRKHLEYVVRLRNYTTTKITTNTPTTRSPSQTSTVKLMERTSTSRAFDKFTRDMDWIRARRGPITREESTTDSSVPQIIIGVLVIVIGIAGGIYFYIKQRRIAYRKSGMADDSDVRFLTADEALDFTLARPCEESGEDDL